MVTLATLYMAPIYQSIGSSNHLLNSSALVAHFLLSPWNVSAPIIFPRHTQRSLHIPLIISFLTPLWKPQYSSLQYWETTGERPLCVNDCENLTPPTHKNLATAPFCLPLYHLLKTNEEGSKVKHNFDTSSKCTASPTVSVHSQIGGGEDSCSLCEWLH